MDDGSSEFYKQNIDEILHKLADLKILILGSYRPIGMAKRLEIIRDCLRTRGFTNTFLVKDLGDEPRFDEDDDIHWTDKSNHWMKNFDLSLFVFFADCDNSGVTDELNYFMTEKIEETFRCIILYEDNIKQISSRIRAKIKIVKLRNGSFKEKKDLDACELAYGFINIVLMTERNRIYRNSHFTEDSPEPLSEIFL